MIRAGAPNHASKHPDDCWSRRDNADLKIGDPDALKIDRKIDEERRPSSGFQEPNQIKKN